MKKLSIAYFGTPQFSADFLETLLTNSELKKILEIKFVVTQPDKPVGKKQIITSSPVKEFVKKTKMPVLERLGRCAVPSIIEGRAHPLERKNAASSVLNQVDFALVNAYGNIIPKELLTLPKYGFINIHWSLLPKYRGAAPLSYALMAGEKKTGVTIFLMDEKLDHGPIIMQEELEILQTDNRSSLELKLNSLAFEMFKKIILRLSENARQPGIELITQDDQHATYAKLLTKQDGFIPFEKLQFQISNSPEKIYNLFRGLQPWPGLWTQVQPDRLNWKQPKRIKIIDMKYTNGRLIIKKVQLEGKNIVDFKTFQSAYRVFTL